MRNLIFPRRLIPAVVLFVSLVPVASFAQAAGTPEEMPALKKWDATGTIGWYHRQISTGLYDRPTSSTFAGATLGRYWTENIKTEIEVATVGRSDNIPYWDGSLGVAGYPIPARMSVSDFQVSAAQCYQFFHNAWFHPFIGAGVVYERERYSVASDAQRLTTYLPGTGTPGGAIDIPAWSRAWTKSVVAPFALGGFKAYVSYHAFFRADLRIAVNGSTHTANTRIGFGFDF